MVSAVLDGDEIREVGLRYQRHFSLSLVVAIALHLLFGCVFLECYASPSRHYK